MRFILKISFLFLLLEFISNTIIGQTNSILKNRIFSADSIQLLQRGEISDLQTNFHLKPNILLMSPSQFADGVFMKHNGDLKRFFIKDNKNVLSILNTPNFELVTQKIPDQYPIGVIIGQSSQNIFYVSPKDKGARFCQFNINDGTYKIITIKDFTVFAIAEIPNDNDYVLVCGVKKYKDINKLGFFKVDINNNRIVDEKHIITLKHSPRGDLSTYSGTFYTMQNRLFFNFDLKSGIFEFDHLGTYIREIKTVDTFTFKKEDETIDCTKPAFGYQELIRSGEDLFVRTNLNNSKERYIVFDKYDLVKGVYKESVKIFYRSLPHNFKYRRVMGTYSDVEGNFHILMSKDNGYENGKYFQVYIPSFTL